LRSESEPRAGEALTGHHLPKHGQDAVRTVNADATKAVRIGAGAVSAFGRRVAGAEAACLRGASDVQIVGSVWIRDDVDASADLGAEVGQ
jgi:hypothetical protein